MCVPPAPANKAGQKPGQHCTVDFADAKHYQTADGFVADPNIELVIICTHHDTHAEFAERALLTEKQVPIKKPFMVDTAETDRVIATAKKIGKILTVYQNRRYDSDFKTLQHLVQNSHSAPSPNMKSTSTLTSLPGSHLGNH